MPNLDRLFERYCEDMGDHAGDWQYDTDSYRAEHMPPFPSFEEWLAEHYVCVQFFDGEVLCERRRYGTD